jgi:xanthine dehydrogenase accessory factor
VLEAAREPSGQVFSTPLEGAAMGRTARVDPAGSGPLEMAAADARRREASTTMAVDGSRVFLEVFPPQPRLLIFGAGHVAMELVPLAAALGFHTIVADGRESFLTRERFPAAGELIRGWPSEAFDRAGLDEATYVCVLSHDPKFDEPALALALPSPARYVGAIGSRKTQAERRRRLTEQGVPAEALDRLRGPIGLDLGGRRPVETALAILAEMVAVRYGGTGSALVAPDRQAELNIRT